MIVVAVIGILATVSAVRVSNLLAKSREASLKGHLGTLRSALSIYYSDNSASYPQDNLSSLTPKYISKIESLDFPGNIHPNTNAVNTGADLSSAVNDTGGWAYVNMSSSSQWGNLAINCSHSDMNGHIWSSY